MNAKIFVLEYKTIHFQKLCMIVDKVELHISQAVETQVNTKIFIDDSMWKVKFPCLD